MKNHYVVLVDMVLFIVLRIEQRTRSMRWRYSAHPTIQSTLSKCGKRNMNTYKEFWEKHGEEYQSWFYSLPKQKLRRFFQLARTEIMERLQQELPIPAGVWSRLRKCSAPFTASFWGFGFELFCASMKRLRRASRWTRSARRPLRTAASSRGSGPRPTSRWTATNGSRRSQWSEGSATLHRKCLAKKHN